MALFMSVEWIMGRLVGSKVVKDNDQKNNGRCDHIVYYDLYEWVRRNNLRKPPGNSLKPTPVPVISLFGDQVGLPEQL